MHRRIATLSPSLSCIRLSNKEQEWFRVFNGEDKSISSNVDFFENLEVNSSRSQWKKAGVYSIATWRERWVLLAFPHGRANVYEIISNKLSLASSFDCPLNVSAVVIMEDEVDDCALIVFGTDEGPGASRIHVTRMTFSLESLSVMHLKSWRCNGGVSSLSPFGRFVLTGFSSCDGVGIFDPFAFNSISSPSVQMRSKIMPSTTSSPRKDRIESETNDTIQIIIEGDGIPLWVSATKEATFILTLTTCGTLRVYEAKKYDLPARTISLGFDAIGIQILNETDVAVGGCRGEVAVVDLTSGQVSKFARTKEAARVDDFAVCRTGEKLFLIQTDADDDGIMKIFDFGRAALIGNSRIKISDSDEEEEEGDDIRFVGTSDFSKIDFSTEAMKLVEKSWESLEMNFA